MEEVLNVKLRKAGISKNGLWQQDHPPALPPSPLPQAGGGIFISAVHPGWRTGVLTPGYRPGPLRGPWFSALRAGGGRIIEDGLGTLLKQGVNERITALKTGNSKLENFGCVGPNCRFVISGFSGQMANGRWQIGRCSRVARLDLITTRSEAQGI